MSRCEYYCIICYEPQAYKLNLIKIHGVCQIHLNSLTDFNTCIHCKSTVPAIYKYQITSNRHTPSTVSSQYLCEYCFENSDITPLDCHKICKSCYKSSCPICKTLIVPSTVLCDFCLTADICTKKSCSHNLCTNCDCQPCQVCELISRPASILSVKSSCVCEYCCSNKYELKCDSQHMLCKECFRSDCPLCESRSTLRIVVCESCGNANEDGFVCKNGHCLCENCRDNCIFCSGELDTGKTHKNWDDIYRCTEKMNDKGFGEFVPLTKAAEFWAGQKKIGAFEGKKEGIAEKILENKEEKKEGVFEGKRESRTSVDRKSKTEDRKGSEDVQKKEDHYKSDLTKDLRNKETPGSDVERRRKNRITGNGDTSCQTCFIQ